MPYKRKGNTIYVKKSGHWKKKGTSKRPKEYMRVLQAIEHGWKPPHKGG